MMNHIKQHSKQIQMQVIYKLNIPNYHHLRHPNLLNHKITNKLPNQIIELKIINQQSNQIIQLQH